MFELKEFLKEVNVNISTSNKKYIYFDKQTGKIKSISSRNNIDLDSNAEYIQVDILKIEDLLNGKRSFDEYRVMYDLDHKQYIVKDQQDLFEYSKRDLFLYEVPKYSNNKLIFKREYQGIHVDVWYKELTHLAGQHVWYDNAVYRILENQDKNTNFNLKNANLIVNNVKLYNDSNKHLSFNRKIDRSDLILDCNKIYSVHEDSTVVIKDIDQNIVNDYLKEVYQGIHVDVWYKELTHLAGQHVWYDNAVYRILENQDKNTNFNINNVELVLDDVKLYKDRNTNLDFEVEINLGDYLLSYNKIYLSKISNSNKKIQQLNNIDVYIKQNNRTNFWSFILNEKTKVVLKSNSIDLNNKIVFGITSKEDPNRLYRLFEIMLIDLVNKPSVTFKYQFNFEFDNEEVSIYTSKYFNTYAYEVIQ